MLGGARRLIKMEEDPNKVLNSYRAPNTLFESPKPETKSRGRREKDSSEGSEPSSKKKVMRSRSRLLDKPPVFELQTSESFVMVGNGIITRSRAVAVNN